MRFRVNTPRVIHETIDGEVVLIDFESGSYFSMGGCGADIWAMIAAGLSAAQIRERVLQGYEGHPAEMGVAVQRLLNQLEQEHLIVDEPEGEARGPSADPEPPRDARKPVFEVPVLRKFTDMQQLLLLDPLHDVTDERWPVKKDDPTGE